MILLDVNVLIYGSDFAQVSELDIFAAGEIGSIDLCHRRSP